VHVFVAGGTGYIGRPLIELLLKDGHSVTGLTRPGSEGKLPAGCTPILGNALDADSYQSRVAPADTFVHLVGVAHPGPGKGQQFREIDLKSIECAVAAAKVATAAYARRQRTFFKKQPAAAWRCRAVPDAEAVLAWWREWAPPG